MSVAYDYSSDRGPNTITDLDALPEEGKGYELVHGWLIPLSPSVVHDEAAEQLREILQPCVPEAYLVRGPWDVRMPDDSIYKPDVAVLDRAAHRAARQEDRRALTGRDVLLAAEIQRPGSGSWNVVHRTKVRDYALAGIAHYWIVDLTEVPVLTVYSLGSDSKYTRTHRVAGDDVAELEEPFPVKFAPSSLTG
ncbi:Uma2 family endonuclease [Actinomadura viridis]|uniref:Uma2 family endonuclease n=1 Tax=Actinomadura viridis TaxID=58110 RepID=A0A931DE16_9ACTN|nr:Uma2 family endonuclease [Actinomadura viridis]MBG6086637.1 Uma2 family endonuclease [Actinomadura viridis]